MPSRRPGCEPDLEDLVQISLISLSNPPAVLELCIFQKEYVAAAASPAGQLAKSIEQMVVDYVEANLSDDIDLAQVAGLSRYHFLRAFRRTTGETPYHYLLLRRVSMAQRLSRNNALSTKEIAIAVGFKDATRLIRAFRKITGITPRIYRAS